MADKRKGFDWETWLGLLDPEVSKIGHYLRQYVPDQILRSEIANRFFGLLKGRIESYSHRFPGLTGALLERTTDIGDAIFNVPEVPGGKGAKKSDPWVSSFLASARKRMAEAEDKKAMSEALRAEFAFSKELFEEIEGMLEEHGALEEPSDIDWAGLWNRLDSILGQAAGPIHGLADWLERSPLAQPRVRPRRPVRGWKHLPTLSKPFVIIWRIIIKPFVIIWQIIQRAVSPPDMVSKVNDYYERRAR